MKVAIYARVSTGEQSCENQLIELRRYAEARGWAIFKEYVDEGVSGSKDRRPALDQLVADAKRRRFDALVCWRLDRLGRNLRHLILLLDELHAVGVAFVSLGEGIDATTPAGRLQLHVLGAIAEFERARIQERVCAGLARARREGRRLGRPQKRIASETLLRVSHLSVRAAARELGVSTSVMHIGGRRSPRMGERQFSRSLPREPGASSPLRDGERTARPRNTQADEVKRKVGRERDRSLGTDLPVWGSISSKDCGRSERKANENRTGSRAFRRGGGAPSGGSRRHEDHCAACSPNRRQHRQRRQQGRGGRGVTAGRNR